MTNENHKLKPLNCDPDAIRWTNEFNNVLVAKGEQPYDPVWILVWFSNAIMCGMDVQRWKMEKELTKKDETIADLKKEIGDLKTELTKKTRLGLTGRECGQYDKRIRKDSRNRIWKAGF